MRPDYLKTKIFLDSGDPGDTRRVIDRLGFLDGQTTNPSLIAKNPTAQERLASGSKFSKQEVFDFYKKVVTEISGLIPNGSVSVEVYADQHTRHEEMMRQAHDMWEWIPNALIKFPTNHEGLSAGRSALLDGMRVNMTLVFTEEQAAAVYTATKGAKRGDVVISPFVGRWDDIGYNGMDLIKNILEMYKEGEGHVEVLSASVRTIEQFLYALALGTDCITAPTPLLLEWADKGMPDPGKDFPYNPEGLKEIPFHNIPLDQHWDTYPLSHELLEKGIERFVKDWNGLIAP